MRLAFSSILVFVIVGPASTSGLHHRSVSGRRCAVGIDFHASVLQAPRISLYSQQQITIPALFLVSPLNACGTTPLLHCCSRCVHLFWCRNRACGSSVSESCSQKRQYRDTVTCLPTHTLNKQCHDCEGANKSTRSSSIVILPHQQTDNEIKKTITDAE